MEHNIAGQSHTDAPFEVFLMGCHCGLPISFAKHLWFVVKKEGTLDRWEILIQKDCCGESWGHLHKNARKPFEPLGLLTLTGRYLWDSELFGHVGGGEGSLAEKMVHFIENSPNAYPLCHNYFLSSPNSNTYVQWVLDHFPEFKVKLPWNAFGKGYEVKV